MIVSCLYMCLCSRFIHTADDGHMRLRFVIIAVVDIDVVDMVVHVVVHVFRVVHVVHVVNAVHEVHVIDIDLKVVGSIPVNC